MDSDKAAVWVTNWDTERNGSSLTTRDGTSYLLANAFMLAYDYGQPHIFSGYYYAGVDDGAPGATRTSVPDMTCPTDGIETAGIWHCAQRWTAIRGMIGFRNAVAGTFTATVAKGSACRPIRRRDARKLGRHLEIDLSDPAWFTGETPHKGDDTAAKSADSAASAKSGDAKSGKATSDAIRRAATLAAILLPVIVGVTFMAIARRNGKAQSDNSGPNND